MNTTSFPPTSDGTRPPSQEYDNRILIKGAITAGLILVMLMPTVYIINLVRERESRQADVVKEVSEKWSGAQTITGPWLYLPYRVLVKRPDGKSEIGEKPLFLLPENLAVNGEVATETRLRSIYKVTLYTASINASGNFQFRLPDDVPDSTVRWNEARICFSLSDFKGIQQKLVYRFKGTDYELAPGLPADVFGGKGLSAKVPLSAADLGDTIPFSGALRLKGSGYLHFSPMAGNSSFRLQSAWKDPSFDGNSLPAVREVGANGFTAAWTFNKANLPFGTVLKNDAFDPDAVDFGVSLLRPADQYAKTERSVKYAILFIGLTFSLFFLVELMQKKPLHPVQYSLIGLALVIFYTLLLSISEYLPFNGAYAIAATAIVALITLYARAHFNAWRPALIFCGVLGALYAFIFALIQLEDTALLIGSIGLFGVLAVVMFASRRIRWYPAAHPAAQ